MKSAYRTISLADADRITGPLAFNLMVKPAGSACNLDCRYCYYLDKAGIYGRKEPVMSLPLLERVISEYMEAVDVPDVQICWHGGEPLLAGIDFYRKAVELERKYASGKRVTNSLQTNGVLLNPEWAGFLHDHDFLVGISIDGPEDIHDRYRRDKGGSPTFSRVMRGIECLSQAGVEYNTMTAVSRAASGRGAEVYRFLKGIGSRYMQFMPVTEYVAGAGSDTDTDSTGTKARPEIVHPGFKGGVPAGWSIDSIEFGKFLCDIFDIWVAGDVGGYFVNIFDSALALWCGLQPGTCVYAETCGGNVIVEHNGDLYPCDHFVYPEYRIGNILDTRLRELMMSQPRTDFGISKRNDLPPECIRCKWSFACHGECPKHRFVTTASGHGGLNILCEGYRHFFNHIAPAMDYMRMLLSQGRAPAEIMTSSGRGLSSLFR